MKVNETYEDFYRRANGSEAFSRYCQEVFGIDLTQDGFADKTQLDYLVNYVHFNGNDTGLDIGCGNGRITGYIAGQTRANMMGIDCARTAISYAQGLAKADDKVSYDTGDINNLNIPDKKFTVMLLIDAIYFSEDYTATLEYLYDKLADGGRIGIYYSDFLLEDTERQKIAIGETKIARILAQKGWNSKSVDFSDQHYNLMKRKNVVSNKYKALFASEGNEALYNRINAESICESMNKSQFEYFSNRYLYCIYK